MCSNSKIKSEFRRRLVILRANIDVALETGSVQRGLLPALFSVFSYIWCKSPEDLIRN